MQHCDNFIRRNFLNTSARWLGVAVRPAGVTRKTTFGPEVIYPHAPAVQNASPLAGRDFLAETDIDAATREFRVAMKDRDGRTAHERRLAPERG